MKGTWQTTDHSSSAPVLLLIGVLLLAGSGGAVAAVSAAVIDALLAAVAVTVLSVVALGVFLVHRARNPSPEGFVRLPGVRMPQRYELPDPERAAIGQAAPRELHQHVHYHYHGAESPREEILRRDQRPEQ
jgi:hypothetical protein